MLKRLREVSSKLSQNKLFLPGFPATSLFFLFFFPTKAYRNSQPLTPPKPAPFLPSFAWPKTHQKTHHLPLLPPSRLDFLLPFSSHQHCPFSCKAKPGQPSPYSHSLPAAPTLSPHHLFRALLSFFFTHNTCRTEEKKEQKTEERESDKDVEERKNQGNRRQRRTGGKDWERKNADSFFISRFVLFTLCAQWFSLHLHCSSEF